MVVDNEQYDAAAADDFSSGFLSTIQVGGDDQELEALDALDFVMSSYDRLSMATASCFEECLPPIRRNSRDLLQLDCDSQTALQFKKKLQLAGSEPMMMMGDHVETPESDILRSRFQLDARCMDPLDKRQSIPFDMSSFIMLSINPKR